MTFVDEAHVERIPIIDTDVHTTAFPTDPQVLSRLPARWQGRTMETFGFRGDAIMR